MESPRPTDDGMLNLQLKLSKSMTSAGYKSRGYTLEQVQIYGRGDYKVVQELIKPIELIHLCLLHLYRLDYTQD